MDDPLVMSALIAAVGGILVAIIGMFVKIADVLQEVTNVKHKTQGLTQKLDHETSPNHGSSLKDSLNRIESDLRGMKRDVGRLADADVEIQHSKAIDHDRIWTAIQELKEGKYDERRTA